jgi:hypothetical protein
VGHDPLTGSARQKHAFDASGDVFIIATAWVIGAADMSSERTRVAGLAKNVNCAVLSDGGGMQGMSELLIELGGVITALGLLTALAVRARVSPIPLFLLAGLAFGKGGILPLATSENFITTGAEIGVILLLFTLGLEYNAQELVSALRRSAPAGIADLALNAVPGAVAALLLGWGPTAAVALGSRPSSSSSSACRPTPRGSYRSLVPRRLLPPSA